MSLNNRRTIVVPINLGRAHDVNPKAFPLAATKKKSTLTAGRLYISTSLNLISMARQLTKDSAEFKIIFEDMESQCRE